MRDKILYVVLPVAACALFVMFVLCHAAQGSDVGVLWGR